MARTLDMQFIRYLNLFEKITKIRTQHCFLYNLTIIFVVPKHIMAKAIGEQGKNVKKLSEILRKKVKVIASPEADGKTKEDIEEFILAIIHPLKFKNLEVEGSKLTINAGRQSKAALIGRNKVRLHEMEDILDSYFGIKELRVA